MVAAARHDAILRELELRGSLQIAQLATRLAVAPMTLRRDLAQLEERGLLVRVHGGAVSRAVAAQQDAAVTNAVRPHRPIATIGMITPSASYYFPAVIRGASDAARELNCRLVLGITNYSEREEFRQAERLITGGGVDALMITPAAGLVEGSPLHELLVEATIPVVVVERAVDERGGGRLQSVRSDHSYGATLAIRHLAELGHTRVALAVRKSPTTAGLIDGYERTMAKLGLSDGRLTWDLPSPESGDDATTDVIERFLDACIANAMTAALVLGDVDAIALVDLAAQRGIRVPDDLAVVAYDDEVAVFASVPLTTIAPPKRDLGDAALRLCVDRLRHADAESLPVTRLAMLPTLIERESSRIRA